MAATGGALFLASGAPGKHIGALILAGVCLFAMLLVVHDYARERVMTFLFHPVENHQTSGYQIEQSFIAIGAGGMYGRGYGNSLQKFEHLPEPAGDSIFAIIAEEFGFIGGLLLISTFVLFLVRGLSIAAHAPDRFGALLVVGIVTYIVVQSFLNIAALLGVAPLTGIPLIFVSQGGTALLVALGASGIVLNVSRHARFNFSG